MSVAVFVLAWTGAAVWLLVLALLATAAYERLTRFHRQGVLRLRRDSARQARARQVGELEAMWDRTD